MANLDQAYINGVASGIEGVLKEKGDKEFRTLFEQGSREPLETNYGFSAPIVAGKLIYKPVCGGFELNWRGVSRYFRSEDAGRIFGVYLAVI